MTYWVEYDKGWTRENLMTDSLIRVRVRIYPTLKSGRYGKMAYVYQSARAVEPIGTMEVDKVGNVLWRSVKKGILGKKHVVALSGELFN